MMNCCNPKEHGHLTCGSNCEHKCELCHKKYVCSKHSLYGNPNCSECWARLGDYMRDNDKLHIVTPEEFRFKLEC